MELLGSPFAGVAAGIQLGVTYGPQAVDFVDSHPAWPALVTMLSCLLQGATLAQFSRPPESGVGASATQQKDARAEPPCGFANGFVGCNASQDIDRLISAASSLANLDADESDSEGLAAPSSCNKDSTSEREQGSLPVSNRSWNLVVPSQPAMDVVNQENLLRSASLTLIEPQQKLPWEEGFWGNFFDHSTPLDECLPPPPTFRPSPCLLQRDIPLVEERVAKKAKPSDSVSRALTSWQDKMEAEHQRALKKWAYLFGVGS